MSAVDLGDVFLRCCDPLSLPGAIEAAATAVLATGAMLIGPGGDHFITLPLMKATAARHGPLAMIQFDAHPYTWQDAPSQEGRFTLDHGTMFRRAVEQNVIDPVRSIQVGIRTWVDDRMGIAILDNVECEDRSVFEIAETIRRTVGDRPCYLTVDIDCLDPAFAPGTGTPVSAGMTPLKLLRIFRAIAGLNIVGCDLVEVSPPYDVAGITALNAATILYEQLVRIARNKEAAVSTYAGVPSIIA
ncbi:arginase family protein [Acidisoma sp. S159]|uniref:arginase family protein n=1 Tax=Acidisoma sp. S159 TaxID=1747225 RepID=UPI00131B44C7|nr:arginase family protein [Acidisoma sp. S159]